MKKKIFYLFIVFNIIVISIYLFKNKNNKKLNKKEEIILNLSSESGFTKIKIKDYKYLINNYVNNNDVYYLHFLIYFLSYQNLDDATTISNYIWNKYKHNETIIYVFYNLRDKQFIKNNQEIKSYFSCVNKISYGDNCKNLKNSKLILDLNDPIFVRFLNSLDDETYPDYYYAIDVNNQPNNIFPKNTFLLDIENNNKRALYWLNKNYLDNSNSIEDLYNIIYLYAIYGNDKELLNNSLKDLWENYNSCELNKLKTDLEKLNKKKFLIPKNKIKCLTVFDKKIYNGYKSEYFNNLKKDKNLLKMLDELKNQKTTID